MNQNSENQSIQKIKEVLQKRPVFPLPRGELWLGTGFLDRAGYGDTLENHFRMVEDLGQDMVCLPIALDMTVKPGLGYRYFGCPDLKHAVRFSGRYVIAVIDGPFQEMVNRLGLISVLTDWLRDREKTIRVYKQEAKNCLGLIHQSLEQGVHAIVMADDLAQDKGLLISPQDIEVICGPFYRQAVSEIHRAGTSVFLHSCGRITGLIPLIRDWDIDGLASVQHGANNLLALSRELGSGRVIMAGMDAELLDSDTPSPDLISCFCRLLTDMIPAGGFVLSSSCGLYSRDFLSRVKSLYRIADSLSEE